MPVVISLLNSFTGVAAACGGFFVRQQSNVNWWYFSRSSRNFVNHLMCNAMNRSLLNVLIGSFGGGAKS